MIRFPCPECGANLKAREDDRGSSIRCPECRTKAKVPAANGEDADPGDDAPKTKRRRGWLIGKPIGPLPVPPSLGQRVSTSWAEMPIISKLLVGASLGITVFACLLALVMHFTGAPEEGLLFVTDKISLPLTFVGAVAFLISLYGVSSGCPKCHAWFAREEKEKQHESHVYYLTPSGERLEPLCEKDDEDGVLEGTRYIRSIARSNYACKRCRHAWKFEVAEEYQKERLSGREE
jgi:hypothetical protein